MKIHGAEQEEQKVIKLLNVLEYNLFLCFSFFLMSFSIFIFKQEEIVKPVEKKRNSRRVSFATTNNVRVFTK